MNTYSQTLYTVKKTKSGSDEISQWTHVSTEYQLSTAVDACTNCVSTLYTSWCLYQMCINLIPSRCLYQMCINFYSSVSTWYQVDACINCVSTLYSSWRLYQICINFIKQLMPVSTQNFVEMLKIWRNYSRPIYTGLELLHQKCIFTKV